MIFALAGLIAVCGIVVVGCFNLTIRRIVNKNRAHPFMQDIQNVIVNGNNIKYVTKGNGDPIIMIHGSQMNSYDWRDNIDFFAKTHRVYAVDMVGCGWSDKPRGEYSPDFFAEFIKDFMCNLNIDKAIFISSSWGGGHTINLSLKYPERINALILSSPCGYKHKFNIMDLLRVPILGRIILLFSSKIMIKSQLEAVYYDKSFVDDKLVNAVYSPFLRQGFIRATLKSYRNADFHFVQDNLNKIKLPTLLIWGDRDTIHPVQMAEEMKNEIKGSQLVVFGECGHLPHSEKSEQFNYHAGKFIAKIQARAYTQYGSKANP